MSEDSRERRLVQQAAKVVHEGLTGARKLVGTPYLARADLRAAYERDIGPRTTAAMKRVLAEIATRLPSAAASVGSAGRRVRAVDLGCGTGAAGAALRAHFGASLELVSVDKFVEGPGIRALDVAHGATVAALGTSNFDVVVAAHVLNELFVEASEGERRLKLARLIRLWAEELLAPGGLIILVEPALRETSRALLQVRDELLLGAGMRGIEVVAPCFYRGACPALLRERDWCHDAAAPAHDAGRQVDFSYLVLARNESPATVDESCVRIVSDPLPEKGKVRLFACGAQGRFPLVRLERHMSEGNRSFGELARGDIARIPRLNSGDRQSAAPVNVRGDGIRVESDWHVERISRD